MTDNNPTSYTAQEIIAAYQGAVKQRKTIRILVAAMILLIVLINLGLIWTTLVDFQITGLPLVQDGLSREMQNYLPTLTKELSAASERVIPVYTEAFAQVFARDQELYAETLLSEFEKLQEYSEAATPKIQEAIAQLVIDQETAASEALQAFMSEDDFAMISVAYQEALEQQLQIIMETHFYEHLSVGQEIIDKLEHIAATEKEVPTSNQVILGMMVELLGLEMQLEGEPLAQQWAESEP